MKDLLYIFEKYQEYLDKEQDIREKIRIVVRRIEACARTAAHSLQIIHTDLKEFKRACGEARHQITTCNQIYGELAAIIPDGEYYRYSDHWTFITQRLVFLCAMVVYLEDGVLVTRETVAEMLGIKSNDAAGFHLDIEDYLIGVLQMASELSRFATNSVTMGDYERPLHVLRFVGDLNYGFRLLNMKNDGLRKRFDALKYDVKKIEEVVYDISIRGLNTQIKKSVETDDLVAPCIDENN